MVRVIHQVGSASPWSLWNLGASRSLPGLLPWTWPPCLNPADRAHHTVALASDTNVLAKRALKYHRISKPISYQAPGSWPSSQSDTAVPCRMHVQKDKAHNSLWKGSLSLKHCPACSNELLWRNVKTSWEPFRRGGDGGLVGRSGQVYPAITMVCLSILRLVCAS